MLARLRGNEGVSLQWIDWDGTHRGLLHVRQPGALVHIDGEQRVAGQPGVLTIDGDVLLGDLGLSRKLTMESRVGTQLGTPPYMAPERFAGQPCAPRPTPCHAAPCMRLPLHSQRHQQLCARPPSRRSRRLGYLGHRSGVARDAHAAPAV